MGFRRLACVALPLLGACSILYNPDNLPVTDAAEIDAPPVDAATDSDPSLLDLTGFDTGTGMNPIPEGTGDEGGRPALVLLAGSSIVGDAVVTAAWEPASADEAPTVDGFDAYADSTGAALGLRIPVLTTLDVGQTKTVRVTVTQGSASDFVDIPVDGLAELTVTAASPTAVDATPDLYSRITVTGNLRYMTGAASPVILRATAGAILSARLDVDAVGQANGPHGCPGGGSGTPGGCSPGGGSAGGPSAVIGDGGGGGGGGFAAQGTTGAGGGLAGMGGMPTGGPMLVPFVTPPSTGGNRGNGGGGGGSGMLVVGTAAGGVGGGGGGAIMLDVGGDITVMPAGALRAAGATGLAGGGAAGGGGGGGSGGAVLVRSGGAITASAAWLSAAGGGAGPGNNAGGAGQVGRVRIDAADGAQAVIEAMATTPAATRGPSWDQGSGLVFATQPTALMLRGHPGNQHGIRVNDVALPTDASIGAGGTAMVTVPLTRGRNRVCATWTTTALSTSLDRPEAKTCIDVAYVGF